MWSKLFAILKTYDWILFLSVILLLSFGLAALYGIATGFEQPDFLNLQKQIAFAITGIVLAAAISLVDYNIFRQFSYLIYIATGILLAAVLFFGTTLRGTTGWFTVFGFNFQPVELAKIALIFFLARFFSERIYKEKDLKFIFISGAITSIFFVLTAQQPDFGSAIILFSIWFASLLVAGIEKKYLFMLIGFLLVAFIFAWFFLFADFQKDRILGFLNPSSDPYGRGYHVRQAVIAVGSGQLFGRGLASGSQSQLQFIPASQTDFIYAVIAEELGFLGAVLVLLFYIILFYRCVRVARRANDGFGFFVALGITVLFFSHFFVNVGMNVGILPVTGIGLPFVSYGGSFLLTSFFMLGILEGIARKSS